MRHLLLVVALSATPFVPAASALPCVDDPACLIQDCEPGGNCPGLESLMERVSETCPWERPVDECADDAQYAFGAKYWEIIHHHCGPNTYSEVDCVVNKADAVYRGVCPAGLASPSEECLYQVACGTKPPEECLEHRSGPVRGPITAVYNLVCHTEDAGCHPFGHVGCDDDWLNEKCFWLILKPLQGPLAPYCNDFRDGYCDPYCPECWPVPDPSVPEVCDFEHPSFAITGVSDGTGCQAVVCYWQGWGQGHRCFGYRMR